MLRGAEPLSSDLMLKGEVKGLKNFLVLKISDG